MSGDNAQPRLFPEPPPPKRQPRWYLRPPMLDPLPGQAPRTPKPPENPTTGAQPTDRAA